MCAFFSSKQVLKLGFLFYCARYCRGFYYLIFYFMSFKFLEISRSLELFHFSSMVIIYQITFKEVILSQKSFQLNLFENIYSRRDCVILDYVINYVHYIILTFYRRIRNATRHCMFFLATNPLGVSFYRSRYINFYSYYTWNRAYFNIF